MPGRRCVEYYGKVIDSYRFLDAISKGVMRHWASLRSDRMPPWVPLSKPLSQCRVALISSAAISLNSDQPFDLGIERNDPWFSDPSYRVLRSSTKTGDVRVAHLHINSAFAEQDVNSVMPLERLDELVKLGEVGDSAPSHYSYIGYTMRPERLLRESVPSMVERLRAEIVDAVVLVPV